MVYTSSTLKLWLKFQMDKRSIILCLFWVLLLEKMKQSKNKIYSSIWTLYAKLERDICPSHQIWSQNLQHFPYSLYFSFIDYEYLSDR
jgi:hypothetical protein